LSHDTPIVSDNLPVTEAASLRTDLPFVDGDGSGVIAMNYFQDQEDLLDEDEDLDDLLPPWEDDTVD